MKTPKDVLQEQFSAVYRHLMAQGEVSLGPDWCLYRASGGLKCAAGCRIPDSDYRPEMEGRDWAEICEKWPEMEVHLDARLGVRLQSIHDNESVSSWPLHLGKVAEDFDLQVPQ